MEQIKRKFYETEAEFITYFMSNMKDKDDTNIIKSLVYQNMVLFSSRAKKYKRWYFITKYISFISPLAITTITSLKVSNAETIILLLSLLASIAIGISGIGKFRENWIRYRFYCEQLKLEIMQFTSDSGAYEDAKSRNKKVNAFGKKIAAIFTSENSEWVNTMTCDDLTTSPNSGNASGEDDPG